MFSRCTLGNSDDIRQQIIPANQVIPSVKLDYKPLEGQRYTVNKHHQILSDMVVQGDSVELTVVTNSSADGLSVEWQLKKKCGIS